MLKFYNANFFTKLNKACLFLLNLGLLFLIIFLPIHNLFLQFSTKVLGLSPYIALYKDFILGCVSVILVVLNAGTISRMWHSLKKFSLFTKLNLFWPTISLAGLHLLFVISGLKHTTQLGAVVFGYYFELWFLVPLLLLLQLTNLIFSASDNPDLDFLKNGFFGFWKEYLPKSIVWGYLPVLIISTVSILFGQIKVLSWFGYPSNYTEVAREAVGLLSYSNSCHLVDFGINFCRLSGTFSHPIHYSAYLLMVTAWFLIMHFFFRKKNSLIFGLTNNLKDNFNNLLSFKFKQFFIHNKYILLAISSSIFCIASITRFAWVSLLAIWLTFVFCYLLPVVYVQFWPKSLKASKISLLVWLSKLTLILVIFLNLFGYFFQFTNWQALQGKLPDSLVKPSSTVWHYRYSMSTFEVLTGPNYDPLFGFGPGSMGSSARSKYQNLDLNPVYNKHFNTALKWWFQPDKFLLTENWYLQAVLNQGLPFGIIYIAILLWPLFFLFRLCFKHLNKARQIMLQGFNKGFNILKDDTYMAFKTNMYKAVVAGLLYASYAATFNGNMLQHLLENQTIIFYYSLFLVTTFCYLKTQP